jgi:type II secretory pathway pseudopilin PulG
MAMPFSQSKHHRHAAYSLVEIMVVFTIIGILTAMAAPTYQRAVQQSKADIAAANLRAIWAAERLYWLEYQEYAPKSILQSSNLLDPRIDADGEFAYSVESEDLFATQFKATATPVTFADLTPYSIDQTGAFDDSTHRIKPLVFQ